jgi:hypothetical protein
VGAWRKKKEDYLNKLLLETETNILLECNILKNEPSFSDGTREPPRVGAKGEAQKGTRRGTWATSAGAQGLGGVFEDRSKDFNKCMK